MLDRCVSVCLLMVFTFLSASVQDWCSAGQVVSAGGSAGLLRRPVGQHVGHSHCAAAGLCFYRNTLWPYGTAESTDTHVRLQPLWSGECLHLSSCTHALKPIQMSFVIITFEVLSHFVYFQVKSVCLSLQDSNVLVQRNMLEVLLYFFPFATCLVCILRCTASCYFWIIFLV